MGWALLGGGWISEKELRLGEPLNLTFASTEKDPNHPERPTLPGALLGESASGRVVSLDAATVRSEEHPC